MPSHAPRQIIAGTDVLESFKTIDQRMWIPEEIVSRIHTAMTAAGWEDISTAPKDGSLFLAGAAHQEHPFICWWHNGEVREWEDDAGWLPGKGPTHWRSFPPPPPKAIEP